MNIIKNLFSFITLNWWEESVMKSIFSIWDFSESKVIIASILAVIVSGFTTFSENYLGISGALSMAIGVVVTSDFILGLIAANKRKDIITSKKGLRSLYKTGAYLLFLYIAYTLYMELEESTFRTAVKYFHVYLIAHICFWEMFSIDENLKKLGINLGLTDILQSILDKLKALINKIG